MTGLTCPDCANDFHDDCTGASWDEDNLLPAVCPCWEANHYGAPFDPPDDDGPDDWQLDRAQDRHEAHHYRWTRN